MRYISILGQEHENWCKCTTNSEWIVSKDVDFCRNFGNPLQSASVCCCCLLSASQFAFVFTLIFWNRQHATNLKAFVAVVLSSLASSSSSIRCWPLDGCVRVFGAEWRNARKRAFLNIVFVYALHYLHSFLNSKIPISICLYPIFAFACYSEALDS